MTSLPDRPDTALLIIDVQRDVLADAHDRDTVIANINTALERVRSSGTPVIWVRYGGTVTAAEVTFPTSV